MNFKITNGLCFDDSAFNIKEIMRTLQREKKKKKEKIIWITNESEDLNTELMKKDEIAN